MMLKMDTDTFTTQTESNFTGILKMDCQTEMERWRRERTSIREIGSTVKSKRTKQSKTLRQMMTYTNYFIILILFECCIPILFRNFSLLTVKINKKNIMMTKTTFIIHSYFCYPYTIFYSWSMVSLSDLSLICCLFLLENFWMKNFLLMNFLSFS